MSRHTWPVLFLPLAAQIAPVYAADYLGVADAQKILFPDATSFDKWPVKLSAEQRSRIKSLSGVRQRWDEQAIWRAGRDGLHMGWFIVDNVIGKHEFITYAVALTPAGKVIGVEIMSYRETHGGQVRMPSWRENFAGKTLADRFRLDEDIPNISGATLSCRNVTDGVKRILALQQVVLPND